MKNINAQQILRELYEKAKNGDGKVHIRKIENGHIVDEELPKFEGVE